MEENKELNNKKQKEPELEDYLETGINGLDLQLNGGIPPGSTILLLGNPGSGIEIFGQQFIYHGLTKNENAWYFITRDPISQLMKEMKNFNWDIEEYREKGDIELIDGYVGRFIGALPPEKLRSLAKRKDLKHGTDISSKLQDYVTKLRTNVQLRGVIDSISDFLEQYGSEKVSNLVKLVSSINRASGGTTIILMTKGMHEEITENKMKHNSDTVIEMTSSKKGNEIERELIIEKIRGRIYPSKVIPYSITEKGIEVQTTERVT